MAESTPHAREYLHLSPGIKGGAASLRARLVLINILVLFLTLLLFGIIVYTSITYRLMEGLDGSLQAQGKGLQLFVRLWKDTNHPFDAAFLDQLAKQNQGDDFASASGYIKLFDPQNGRLLQQSPNLRRVQLPFDTAAFKEALRGQKVLKTYQDTMGRQVRILTFPLYDTSRHIEIIAQVGQSLESVKRVQLFLIIALCTGSVLAACIVYWIGFGLTGKELQPLRELSTAMRSMSLQRLRQRFIPPRPAAAEVRLLTEAYNHMLEQLEESFELQRDVVANISHELRAPLTSIRGQVDVLLLNSRLEDDTRREVQLLQVELRRLSRLVNNLLMMARAEIGIPLQPRIEEQPIELDLLLVEVVRQAQFLNPEVGLEIGNFRQITIPGDADLLKQLLLNLVENALIYTPPGGVVRLDAVCTAEAPEEISGKKYERQEQRKWAKISIRDTGPGISSQDLPHIFERGYRAHSAAPSIPRSRSGSGLGLAIALMIAQAHGSMITVESELGKGSCFQVWLPGCAEMAGDTPLP